MMLLCVYVVLFDLKEVFMVIEGVTALVVIEGVTALVVIEGVTALDEMKYACVVRVCVYV